MKRPVLGRREKDNVPHRINTFSFALYHELGEPNGNLFVSPFSLSTCLAMAYGGVRGKTARQMADVLGSPSDQSHFLEILGTLCQGSQ